MHYSDLADNGKRKNLRDKSIGYNLAFFIHFLSHSTITICNQCRAVTFRVGGSQLCSLKCLCEVLHDDCAERFCWSKAIQRSLLTFSSNCRALHSESITFNWGIIVMGKTDMQQIWGEGQETRYGPAGIAERHCHPYQEHSVLPLQHSEHQRFKEPNLGPQL